VAVREQIDTVDAEQLFGLEANLKAMVETLPKIALGKGCQDCFVQRLNVS